MEDYRSRHPGGVNFLFADGSIRVLKDGVAVVGSDQFEDERRGGARRLIVARAGLTIGPTCPPGMATTHRETTMLRPLRAVSALAMTLAFGAVAARAADFVWIEGEAPSSTSLKFKAEGAAHEDWLSGGRWLMASIEAGNVEKDVPANGGLLAYQFEVEKAGTYQVWDRIGFEFVRSPFEWRIDGGGWSRIGPEALTTDAMELSLWCEVAWLKLGDKALAAGPHTLEIRLPRTVDEKGATARVLYASDAFCLHSGKFAPDSGHKPGEDARDAKDREAGEVVFHLPEPATAEARASVALAGLWEVCRDDEQLPGETATPIAKLPETRHWKGIPVPSDRNESRPDLLFAHRFWYRTRVKVPESAAGRSFRLVFPQNNLNTTVFVNGVPCGFNKNPFARFEIDVTKAVKPGVNEVWVGIRDAWYGYSANPDDPMKLRKKFNMPPSFTRMGFQDLAYPIWNAFQSGILVTPEFVSAGPVTAADVFCKPSVARKELAVDVTLANRTAKAAEGEVVCEAVDPETGAVAKALPARPFSLAAGAEAVIPVVGPWEDPKLWWPDAPKLYHLRTTVKVGGEVVEASETPFGFREWTIRGKDFLLNGLVRHLWNDQHAHATREEWLAHHRKTRQTTTRFWGTSWYGLSPDKALDYLDRQGIVVRRQGMLDGEAIGYNAIETDPALKKESEIKMDLMRNWRDQMVAQVKGERNHPSIMIWSIENEWLYINCINLYGGLMDQFEAEVAKTSEAVRAVDPTRPTMTDGGGANQDNAMPVHGNHYVFADDGDFAKYPARAYEANPKGGGRGRWAWDEKRPRYLGEDFFANGINPFDYSYFGGEETFQGKSQSRRAGGIIARMLTEGYRWAGFGAWDLYAGQAETDDYSTSNSPRAAFCRDWDWTFGSGQKVTRRLGVFNDTRSEAPITFTRTLEIGGKAVARESSTHRIAPGANEKFDVTLAMPAVDSRQEGRWLLTLAAEGAEVFRDEKAVSVLPDGRNPAAAKGLAAGELAVFDPKGTVAAFLHTRGMPFTAVEDFKALPEGARVLIVGKDALDPVEAASSRLAAFASEGRTVLVLEQKNPLRYQAVPAAMEAAANEGRTAFIEDLDHPAFRGLAQKDFFTWGPGEVVYRDAYLKPTRGARSLVQCHLRLQNSALAEVPAGKGLLLLSQLVIGETLADNAVARQLLENLIAYGAGYRLEPRQVATCVGDDPRLAKALDAIGLQSSKADDPLRAISATKGGIAVIAATPANLKALASHKAEVDRFHEGGGWVVLVGLTPDGLADYNTIVGFDHMIRPFRQERVAFPPTRSPLTAGLSTAEIVMQSGKRINDFSGDIYLASDVFSYVVDYDDVAPFAKFPEAKYFGYDEAGNDHNPLNMVNGFASADGWQYIFSIPLKEGVPRDFTLSLPKPQEIVEFEWAGNAFYNPVTKVELGFDGRVADALTFATRPDNQPQTFPIDPPRKAQDISIRLADWAKVSPTAVIGVDNLRLKARRPAQFYKDVRPMLNLGALMEYRKGPGGVVLCNVLFQDRESVPENLEKKRAILAAILRNLKAPFSGGPGVIAGAKLAYRPLDLSKQANQFRDDRGWFGDKAFTFKDLPVGRQVFAGVPFEVYNFKTSPVPTVVMLGGPGIPNAPAKEVRGIPVHLKADALFFLHAARIDNRRNEAEVREKKAYEIARYVVHYADGQTADIPLRAEIDVDDFKQRTPSAIPGAQVAWTRPFEGTEFTAVAYSKPWDNPRPDAEIASIDLIQVDASRGVPALIAVTAASAKP